MLLAVSDSVVNQLGVLGLLGSGENEGRVGGGILWLVLADGCEGEERSISICLFLIAGKGLHILAKSPESHTTTWRRRGEVSAMSFLLGSPTCQGERGIHTVPVAFN